MLQAYDSIATADFTLIVPKDEVSSEQLLFNLSMKQEKDEIIAVENCEIEETEVEKDSDVGDEKITAAVLGDTNINDEQSDNSDETQGIDDTDGNKREDNTDHDMNTSVVTVADARNENADVFCLNLTMTKNKESAFEPLVPDHIIDNKMHVTESVQNVSVTSSDTTEEHDEDTNIHVVEHQEEGMMVETTDSSVRTIRMFRNARETLVSTSLKCSQSNNWVLLNYTWKDTFFLFYDQLCKRAR